MSPLEWLKQDITSLRTEVKEDFTEVNEKLDSLLKFKWQAIGGTVVVCFVTGLVINIGLAIMSR